MKRSYMFAYQTDPDTFRGYGFRQRRYKGNYAYILILDYISKEKMTIMQLKNNKWVYESIVKLIDAYELNTQFNKEIWDKLVDIARPFLISHVEFEKIEKFMLGEAIT